MKRILRLQSGHASLCRVKVIKMPRSSIHRLLVLWSLHGSLCCREIHCETDCTTFLSLDTQDIEIGQLQSTQNDAWNVALFACISLYAWLRLQVLSLSDWNQADRPIIHHVFTMQQSINLCVSIILYWLIVLHCWTGVCQSHACKLSKDCPGNTLCMLTQFYYIGCCSWAGCMTPRVSTLWKAVSNCGNFTSHDSDRAHRAIMVHDAEGVTSTLTPITSWWWWRWWRRRWWRRWWWLGILQRTGFSYLSSLWRCQMVLMWLPVAFNWLRRQYTCTVQQQFMVPCEQFLPKATNVASV